MIFRGGHSSHGVTQFKGDQGDNDIVSRGTMSLTALLPEVYIRTRTLRPSPFHVSLLSTNQQTQVRPYPGVRT